MNEQTRGTMNRQAEADLERATRDPRIHDTVSHLRRTTPDRQKALVIATAIQMDLSSVISRLHETLDLEVLHTLIRTLASVETIADYLTPDE